MKEILPSHQPSGLRPAIGPQLPISPSLHMPQPKELGRPNPKQNGPSGPATPPKYQTLPPVRDTPGSSLAPDRPPPNATWGLASWGSSAPAPSPTFAGCHCLLRRSAVCRRSPPGSRRPSSRQRDLGAGRLAGWGSGAPAPAPDASTTPRRRTAASSSRLATAGRIPQRED